MFNKECWFRGKRLPRAIGDSVNIHTSCFNCSPFGRYVTSLCMMANSPLSKLGLLSFIGYGFFLQKQNRTTKFDLQNKFCLETNQIEDEQIIINRYMRCLKYITCCNTARIVPQVDFCDKLLYARPRNSPYGLRVRGYSSAPGKRRASWNPISIHSVWFNQFIALVTIMHVRDFLLCVSGQISMCVAA